MRAAEALVAFGRMLARDDDDLQGMTGAIMLVEALRALRGGE